MPDDQVAGLDVHPLLEHLGGDEHVELTAAEAGEVGLKLLSLGLGFFNLVCKININLTCCNLQ